MCLPFVWLYILPFFFLEFIPALFTHLPYQWRSYLLSELNIWLYLKAADWVLYVLCLLRYIAIYTYDTTRQKLGDIYSQFPVNNRNTVLPTASHNKRECIARPTNQIVPASLCHRFSLWRAINSISQDGTCVRVTVCFHTKLMRLPFKPSVFG